MNVLLPVLLKKIGYQEYSTEDDFTKCLRQEIAKWACALGDPDCRNNAITKLEWHLANPDKNKYIYEIVSISFLCLFFLCCATLDKSIWL